MIYFIRHGESLANAARDAGSTATYLMEDPQLSEKGVRDAARLSWEMSQLPHPPELVVVSPLRRTMQTAALAFGSTAPFVLHRVHGPCALHEVVP